MSDNPKSKPAAPALQRTPDGQYIARLGRVNLVMPPDTAQYVRQQARNMPPSQPWPQDFPKAVIHTALDSMKKDWDFWEAKAGDHTAADRLVSRIAKPQVIQQLRERYPTAIIAYSHGAPGTTGNQLPRALATQYEKAGMQVNHGIIQTASPGHTGAGNLNRLLLRSRYTGEIEPGRDYIVLDDQITSGGTLRDLRSYIEQQGGHVVAFTGLSASRGGTFVQPREEQVAELRSLGITDQQLQRLGIASSISHLTSKEVTRFIRLASTPAVCNAQSIEQGKKEYYQSQAPKQQSGKTEETEHTPQKHHTMEQTNQTQSPQVTPIQRQAELLAARLRAAAQHPQGILLNEQAKAYPTVYQEKSKVHPANALLMAMHSDQGGYATNVYTSYRAATKRDEAVKRSQSGVPYSWKSWNEYVNRQNPEQRISRADYRQLGAEEQKQYKPGEKTRQYSTLHNVDQTTMDHVHKEEYTQLTATHGHLDKNDKATDRQLQKDIAGFMQKMNDNLVQVKATGTPVAKYDKRYDTVRMPDRSAYPSTESYAQDAFRQIARATGSQSRLDRATTEKGDASRDLLVTELVAAYKMLEMGRPAALSPQAKAQAETLATQIEQDPEFAEQVLQDTQRSIGMIAKAEQGEKITQKVSLREQWNQQVAQMGEQVKFSRVSMMKDTADNWTLYAKPEAGPSFAVHPSKEELNLYFTSVKNAPAEQAAEFKSRFAQKFMMELAEHPDRQVKWYQSQATPQEMALIEKANIFKGREGQLLMQALIAGEKQKVRPVSNEQWQNLFLADDMKDYKQHLAATLYVDVLAQKIQAPAQKQEVKEEIKQEVSQTPELSPTMKQWKDLKTKHPDALLLFRAGDFYMMLDKDARKGAEILGITVTRSSKEKNAEGKALETAAFPHHALDTYLPKLIRAGQRVAICDQIESRKENTQQQAVTQERQEEHKEQETQKKEEQQATSRGFHR